MSTDREPTASTYLGLFFVALATVMYEIVLTRIFSVTMWYHFAFVAISVAMFGMTVGAIIVYLRPAFFTQERVAEHLTLGAVLFAVSAVVSFVISLFVPFDGEVTIGGLLSTGLTYAIIAVPFVFSGICVALALTKFSQRVGKLYACDLIGAATGCLLVIVTLNVTDGPTAVIAVGALAGLAAVFFGARASPRLRRASVAVALVLGAFAAAHTVLVRDESPLVRLQWVKGRAEPRPLYEKWNSFSRVTVFGDPTQPTAPAGWGVSATFRPERGVRQLSLLIDASAGTVLTGYDGNPADLEHLKYDVTNLVHYVRQGARVLVIGVGGGRDVLSAVLFGQRSVLGVEINQDIIGTVNGKFGGFTGHLDRLPQVRFVNDEARSYIARQTERFDIIQISLIDTWAATSAGAFVLTENSLYTAEAWKLFLDRLSPNGILAVSRYHFRSRPDETYRLTSLAHAALTRAGVTDPRRHVVIVRQIDASGRTPVGIATMLVSRAPFSDRDLDTIEAVAQKMQFEVVLSPRFSADDTFTTLASAGDPRRFLASFPVNIAAPTDDSPFFFHTLRLRNVFDRAKSGQELDHINMKAVSVLGALLVVVIVLTLLCIVVPLAMTTERADLRGSVPLLVFFGSIGLGFMFVEISQLHLQPLRGALLPARVERRRQLPDEHGRGARGDGAHGAALPSPAGRPLRVRDREPRRHPRLPGIDDAGARPARDGDAVAPGTPDGDGLPAGHAARVRAHAPPDAVALGNQRRHVRMRLGARDRHRAELQHLRRVLDRSRLLRRRVPRVRVGLGGWPFEMSGRCWPRDEG